MPSSHNPLDYGGKQAAKKKVWNPRSLHVSHVRFQSLIDCCLVEGFFVCFSCGTHKIMATEILLVCGEDLNRSGQLGQRILENLASIYGAWLKFMPLFYSSVFLLCSYLITAYLLLRTRLRLFSVFSTVPADKVASKSIRCCLNCCA